MTRKLLTSVAAAIVFVACTGTNEASIVRLYQLLSDVCHSGCSCSWQGGGSSCSVEQDCSSTPNTCAQCSCSNKGCSSSCSSQQESSDPVYIPLTGKPVVDFTVEDFTLGAFRDLIEASGWDTSGFVSGTAVPYTKTYTGSFDFDDLLDAVAADLDVCYEVNEEDLEILFEDCD